MLTAAGSVRNCYLLNSWSLSVSRIAIRVLIESSAGQASSSIGRASVSKTEGWGFETLLACQPSLTPADGRPSSEGCPAVEPKARRLTAKVDRSEGEP